jgi:hypothetical protein
VRESHELRAKRPGIPAIEALGKNIIVMDHARRAVAVLQTAAKRRFAQSSGSGTGDSLQWAWIGRSSTCAR